MFDIAASTMMTPEGFEPQYKTYERTSDGKIRSLIFLNRRSNLNRYQIYTLKPYLDSSVCHYIKIISYNTRFIDEAGSQISLPTDGTPQIMMIHEAIRYTDGTDAIRTKVQFVNRNNVNQVFHEHIMIDNTDNNKLVCSKSEIKTLYLVPQLELTDVYQIPIVHQDGSSYLGYLLNITPGSLPGVFDWSITDIPEFVQSYIHTWDSDNIELSTNHVSTLSSLYTKYDSEIENINNRIDGIVVTQNRDRQEFVTR